MPNRQYFPRPLIIKGDSAGSQAQSFTLTGLLTLQAGLTVSGGSISASGIAATVGALTATSAAVSATVGVLLNNDNALIRFRNAADTITSGELALRAGQASYLNIAVNQNFELYTNNLLRLEVANTGGLNFQGNAVSMGALTATEVRASSDLGGAANTNSLTNISDTAARSTGVGTILFDDVTNRNSAGFIKFYVGVTAYYVPIFAAI